MNRVAEKMTGWDQTEARGMPLDKVFRIMNEETRQFVISPVTKVLSSGEVVGLANHTVLVARDGTEIPIDDSAAPITDEGVIRGVVLVFSDVSARKAAERSLREKEIMERLVGAQEAERHRIARDLHDHLGQKMTALRLKIESLSRHAEEVPGIAAAINDARASAAQIDQDIGFLSWELMPTELHQLGLEDALSSFVREWSAQYGIPAEFHSQIAGPDGDGGRFSPEIETNLYRIVQEALHNIVKHSRSSQANVLLHHRDRVISLIVEDDGVGFDGSQNGSRNGRGGMGLTGMKERAALLGGSLEIESRAGEGTTLIVRIPLS
jgi:PAS domain S-box-containing protein